MRILIPITRSPLREPALRLGAQIAARAGDPPTLLTVIRDESRRAEGEAILESGQQVLGPEISQVQSVIRVGHAAEQILSEAEHGQYELIIIGEREKEGLVTRFVLGSTSGRVAEHAPCPVMIAKGQVREIRRVLVCDSWVERPGDTSPLVPPVLNRTAAQLLEMFKGDEQVTVLHVMSQISASPGVDSRQLRAEAEEMMAQPSPEGELLKRDIDQLARIGVKTRAKIRHGLVVDEILDEARSGDYDLVVIGAHRGKGWQRVLLDDIARKTLAAVDRPILIVR